MSNARASYEVWHRDLRFAASEQTPWRELLSRHLDGAVHLEERTVLEIGCGRGEIAIWLSGQQSEPRLLMAADLALSAVSKGQLYATSHHVGRCVRWSVTDITRLPFAASCFDTVVSCETVEHVPSPQRAIAELARVLKPGGWLLLTTPNYLNAAGLYRGYLRLRGRRFSEAGQLINNFMMLPLVRRMLTRQGLRIVAIDGCVHYLPFVSPDSAEKTLGRLRGISKWLAVQTIVVARKPFAVPYEDEGDRQGRR